MDVRVGVLVYDGFQEVEFWYPVLRFREENARVTVLGAVADRTCVSRLGYPVVPDAALDERSPGDFDVLVLPGGGSNPVATGEAVVAFVAEAARAGAVVGVVSEAAGVADRAGLSGERLVRAASADDLPGFFKALVAASGGSRGQAPAAAAR